MALSSGEDAESDGLRVQLLTDIRDIFEDRCTDRISSEELTVALVGLEERPWMEYSRGKPLTRPSSPAFYARSGQCRRRSGYRS